MSKGQKNEVDLVKGQPAKGIFLFAVPLIFANLFFQLYETVDTIIVGRFNGDAALAAVGASFAVTMVMIAFATGTGVGCSVLISKYYGSQNYAKVKTAVSTVLIFSLIFSVIIGLLGILLTRTVLVFLGTPENIMEDAVLYLKIYSLGMPFMFLYNVQSSIFSSFGNSKMPLFLLILSSVLNILLDLLFVGVLHMGVMGAAVATVLAQSFSFLVSFVLLIKKVYLGEEWKSYEFQYFSLNIMKEMVSYAFVSIIQSSITSVGLLLIQSVVNRYGSDVLAGYTAGSKIDSFAIVPFMAVGNALSTYTAQNLGAGKRERIGKGFWAGIMLCAVMAVGILLINILFRNQLIGLYLDADTSSADAVDTGLMYISQMSVFYFFMGLSSCQSGKLRGEGRLKILFINCFISLAVRVGFAFTMVSWLGVSAVWLSLPAGWIISSIYMVIAQKAAFRKKPQKSN